MSARPAQVRLVLRPEAASAARARHALLRAGLGQDLEHTVTLLATELVTNAVRHSGVGEGDTIVLVAAVEPDFARIDVHDPGPGFDPEVRHSAKGFGLRLLDTLATRWGAERGTGCHVWFEVDRRSGRRFARGEARGRVVGQGRAGSRSH